MQLIKVIVVCLVAFVLVIPSLPFIFIMMGYAILGDEDKADWWLFHSPAAFFMVKVNPHWL